MNLGWKLAAVVQGRAAVEQLDTYHTERHPVGLDLLEHTSAQTALIGTFSAEMVALRAMLNKLIPAHPSLSRDLAQQLSGLSVAYPSTDPRAHPLTGTRAPDLDGRLFTLLHDGRAILVNLSNAPLPTAQDYASARGLPTVEINTNHPQWTEVGAAVIRPDGHVWWAANKHATLDQDTRTALSNAPWRSR